MICYVYVFVFRQVLRLPFWFNVYAFLFTRKFYGYCFVLFCVCNWKQSWEVNGNKKFVHITNVYHICAYILSYEK